MWDYSKKRNVPESSDAEVVNLLKISGAIIMGKTVTTELAYFDPGKTTNPHDKIQNTWRFIKWVLQPLLQLL